MRRTEVKRQLSSYEKMQLRENVIPVLQDELPSLFMSVNVAQYRAFQDAYSGSSTAGKLPAYHAVSFANGCGKTHMLIYDIIGWTCGSSFLNAEEFPPEAVAFWDGLASLRDAGKLNLRLVCMSDDMKDGGSVLSLLKEIFPWAKTAAADGMKCYRQIKVPHPTLPRVENTVTIKTFDQDEVKHSGSTCHRIWINEILPGKLLGETMGRIRSKKGNIDGSILNTATMLDQAGYLEDMEDDAEVSYVNSRGHLYENCVGEDVTEEMAQEVYESIGVRMKKNPDGPGYLTNGVLTYSSIQTMIAVWKKRCPDQLEARKSGKFMRGAGRIWVTYNPEIHDVLDDMYDTVPRGYPVVQIVDPHSAKPDFSGWAMVTPLDRLVFFAEWPDVESFGPYERLDYRKHTIAQTCDIWRRIEADYGINSANVFRVGDPNRFLEPNPRNNRRLYNDYADEGFRFWLGVDDNLDSGHRCVSEYLYYDQVRFELDPNDMLAIPHMLFAKRCVNIRRAVQRYGFKQKRDPELPTSENLDKKFKEGADIIRYLAKWHQTHSYATIKNKSQGPTDYELVRQGRLPKHRRTSGYDFNPKGRRVLSDSGVYA